MNHLMPHQQPAWIEAGFPELHHWAAAAAWEHTGSRYVLLKLWCPHDPEGCAGAGAWQYELLGPGGQRRVAVMTHDGDPRPVERLLELAEAAIRVMEAEPSAGGGGNSGGPGR